MKSGSWSIEWMLGATAGIFFLMGKFFAPYYESLSNAVDQKEGTVISDSVLIASGVFAVLFIARLVYRFRAR